MSVQIRSPPVLPSTGSLRSAPQGYRTTILVLHYCPRSFLSNPAGVELAFADRSICLDHRPQVTPPTTASRRTQAISSPSQETLVTVDALEKTFGASQPFGKTQDHCPRTHIVQAVRRFSLVFLTGTQGVDPLLLLFACGFFLYQPQVSSSLTKINTPRFRFHNDEPVQYGTARPCLQDHNVQQPLEPNSQVSLSFPPLHSR